MGHESFRTFFSSYRQFVLGKVPHSIDGDNKLYCPVNICFRLPLWYCRLGAFDLVFTGCPTTEELEITGTFSFYCWNTGKLYHRAGKFCVFWNIGKRIMLAQKATGNASYGEGESGSWFLCLSGAVGMQVWDENLKLERYFCFEEASLTVRVGADRGVVVLFLIKPVALHKRGRFPQSCSVCSFVSLYETSLKCKAVSIGQSRLSFRMGCRI